MAYNNLQTLSKYIIDILHKEMLLVVVSRQSKNKILNVSNLIAYTIKKNYLCYVHWITCSVTRESRGGPPDVNNITNINLQLGLCTLF